MYWDSNAENTCPYFCFPLLNSIVSVMWTFYCISSFVFFFQEALSIEGINEDNLSAGIFLRNAILSVPTYPPSGRELPCVDMLCQPRLYTNWTVQFGQSSISLAPYPGPASGVGICAECFDCRLRSMRPLLLCFHLYQLQPHLLRCAPWFVYLTIYCSCLTTTLREMETQKSGTTCSEM